MDSLPWYIGIFIVVALLFANAVFVAAEFALVTVRRGRMELLAEEGNASARRVLRTLGNLDYFVAASQLGITMASIALGFVGEPVLAGLIEPPVEAIVGSFAPAIAHALAIAVAFFLITSLHIVLAEFVPKSIALQDPDGTSMAVAGPIGAFSRIFGPVIWLLNAGSNALLGLLGMALRPIREQPLAAEDIAFNLESSASAGLISRRELRLAQHALELESTPAADMMIPRNEIVGIPIDSERKDVLRVMAEQRHTRFPVFDKVLDNIAGVIDTKEVLLDEDRKADWRRHIQPATILPETADVLEVIGQARQGKSELVFLIDEYGGVAGMLSFFDIAERLAGRLPEDLESDDPVIQRNPDGSLTIDGQARLEELEDALGLDFSEETVQTIGGLVMEGLGRIPRAGDRVLVRNYQLEVVEMDGHRIVRVLMTPVANQNTDAVMAGGAHE